MDTHTPPKPALQRVSRGIDRPSQALESARHSVVVLPAPGQWCFYLVQEGVGGKPSRSSDRVLPEQYTFLINVIYAVQDRV